jgi:hypothetical protein
VAVAALRPARKAADLATDPRVAARTAAAAVAGERLRVAVSGRRRVRPTDAVPGSVPRVIGPVGRAPQPAAGRAAIVRAAPAMGRSAVPGRAPIVRNAVATGPSEVAGRAPIVRAAPAMGPSEVAGRAPIVRNAVVTGPGARAGRRPATARGGPATETGVRHPPLAIDRSVRVTATSAAAGRAVIARSAPKTGIDPQVVTAGRALATEIGADVGSRRIAPSAQAIGIGPEVLMRRRAAAFGIGPEVVIARSGPAIGTSPEVVTASRAAPIGIGADTGSQWIAPRV